jgi:Glucose / Sorbosone dehydrogenase
VTRKTKLAFGFAALALLSIAEFALPHYVSRLFTRLTIDLGLAQAPVKVTLAIPEDAVQSNEFAFVFEPMPKLVVKGQAAGVSGVPGQAAFWIAEQGQLALGPYDIAGFLAQNGFDNPVAFTGGVKQLVTINDTNFALGGFNAGPCYFVALINLDLMAMVDRFPCLPDGTDALDFKGLGGGYDIRDGALFIAIGTASDAVPSTKNDLAQDPASPYGKILRYDIVAGPDGVALENRQIYTSGHRNPQGMLWMDGLLLAVEHGPKGGDEINLIAQGKNYGWPVYSAGSGYDDGDIPSFAAQGTGFTNPIFSFVPSIGISDLSPCPSIIADKKGGNADCLIISAMRDQAIYIVLGDFAASQIYSVERVPVGVRVREVFVVDDVMYLVPDVWHIIRVKISAF